MRKPIPYLTCSQDDFESIHAAVDKSRKTSQTVTVPRAAMAALLMDHSKLINNLEQR